jgi:hypothetical protein
MLTAQQAKDLAQKYVPPVNETLGLVLAGIENRAKQGHTSWSIPSEGLYPVQEEVDSELKKLGYGTERETRGFEQDEEDFLVVTW